MAAPLLKDPFTMDAYPRLGELGVLREDDRVELIAGQVVAMTPIGDRHASCLRRLNRLFAQHLLDVAVIDVQDPSCSARTTPPSRMWCCSGRAPMRTPQHPRAAEDRIYVYREPAGGEYASVGLASRGGTITPLHFPNATLAADEILK